MHDKYPNLFSPIKIGPYTLRNRIVSTAMTIRYLTVDGHMTEDSYAFFEAFARGGASVVTLGNALVDSVTGNNHGNVLRLDDPTVMSSLIQASDRIKSHGALASIQLMHPGRRADPKFNKIKKVFGPSGGICHYGSTDHEVTEMDEEVIDHIVNAFGDAAEMAKLAGFSMCQVQGGHGWLLNQFLSPANNQRTDRFGGSLENRCRFAVMVVENIRKKCGPNFPIEFRLSGEDFMEDGATLEDTVGLAKILNDKVDCFQVSAASFNNPLACLRMFPNEFLPRGCNAYLAAEIRKHVTKPVITVGGFNDPVHMEQTIAEGTADIIALGRAITIEPEFANKVRSGHEDDIVYCLRCGLCMSANYVPYIKYAKGVRQCTLNPWAGRPGERLRIGSYHSNQNVLVVGAGPGGMQAALGAAQNGCHVLLCEKSERLGGAMNYAAYPSFKKDIARYIEVLGRRIERAENIELRLNTEVTPEFLQGKEFDTVIFALGAEPIVPPIPSINSSKVIHGIQLEEKNEQIGDNVVIIGGGLVGCEEGIELAMRGKHVTILEMKEKLAPEAPYITNLATTEKMKEFKNIDVLLKHTCCSITDAGVKAKNAQGEEIMIPADTILLAAGMRPKTSAVDSLRIATNANVICVGDCVRPATIYQATYNGFFAGYDLR